MRKIYILLFTISSTYAFAQLPSNLKAYYTFNGHLNDSTGLNSAGTNNGASPAADRYSLNNRAYEFDGSGTNIDIGTSLNFPATTVALWFKPTNVTPLEQIMISNDRNTSQDLTTHMEIRLIRQTGENIPRIMAFINFDGDAPGSIRVYHSQATVNPAIWNHVSVVVANNYTNIKIYINGVLDTDTPVTGVTYVPNVNTMRIGTRSHPTNEGPYNGRIDEVMIFDKALNDAEVKNIYGFTNSVLNTKPEHAFCIAPNPLKSANVVTINFEAELRSYDLKVYDISGREVSYSGSKIDDKTLKIQFEKIPAGLYFIRLSGEGKTVCRKLIVQD